MTIGKLNENAQGQAERSRSYDSPRRREQARATRTAIAHAARHLLVTRGWAATRVRDVAEEAGVAEATVYAAYGSKAGLARALVDAVDLAAEVDRSAEQVVARNADPAAQLAALVAADRRLFERGGDVIALLRDAGRTEPGLRAAYDDGRARADELRRAVFATWPRDRWLPGVDVDRAADTFAALCNVEVYQILIAERGWTPDEVESWWRESLERLLVAEGVAR